MQASERSFDERLQDELAALDDVPVEVDGKLLKPSQCYHLEMEPRHILFNTNCPDSLREMIMNIVNRC